MSAAAAAAAGGAAGFVAALAMGRQDFWSQFLAAGPVLAAALWLTCATYVEARRRGARGCRAMAACHAASLILWPLFMTLHPAVFALAPLAAMGSVLLLASCWTGATRTIYRTAGQAALVAALAGHQGALALLG